MSCHVTHYLVLQCNRDHDVNLPSASISRAPSQQQDGNSKVEIWQSSATPDVRSQEVKQAVQDCSRWQNRHAQLKLQNKPADLLPPTDQWWVQFFFGDVHWLSSLKGRSSRLCTLIWKLAVERNGRVMPTYRSCVIPFMVSKYSSYNLGSTEISPPVALTEWCFKMPRDTLMHTWSAGLFWAEIHILDHRLMLNLCSWPWTIYIP